jgi:hypothetical protein
MLSCCAAMAAATPLVFGPRLAHQMDLRGIGIRARARATGLDAGNLTRVLQGQRTVPLAYVAPITDALGCSASSARALAVAALRDHELDGVLSLVGDPVTPVRRSRVARSG